MDGQVFQNWSTVRGLGASDFVQDESGWMNLSGCQDTVFWLHVTRTGAPGIGQLEWKFQTAPTRDSSLFQNMKTQVVSSPTIVVLPALIASAPNVPLSTWVRWVISATGSGSDNWDATFRVLVAVNERANTSLGLRANDRALA